MWGAGGDEGYWEQLVQGDAAVVDGVSGLSGVKPQDPERSWESGADAANLGRDRGTRGARDPGGGKVCEPAPAMANRSGVSEAQASARRCSEWRAQGAAD
ncbi:hypothetical protein GCM10010483_29370 [Actinokineospora diospyrosa]